jgi:hypothetical protein
MAAQKPGKGVLVHLGHGELAQDLHNCTSGDFALVVQYHQNLHLWSVVKLMISDDYSSL